MEKHRWKGFLSRWFNQILSEHAAVIFLRICSQWQFASYSFRYRKQYDREQLFTFKYPAELLQYCFGCWKTVPQTKSCWPILLLKRFSDSTLTQHYRTTFWKECRIFVVCLLSVKLCYSWPWHLIMRAYMNFNIENIKDESRDSSSARHKNHKAKIIISRYVWETMWQL